jgi:hypothetical protein
MDMSGVSEHLRSMHRIDALWAYAAGWQLVWFARNDTNRHGSCNVRASSRRLVETGVAAITCCAPRFNIALTLSVP